MKAKTPESRLKANAKFQAAHTRRFTLKLVDTTDADIIAKLESMPNKQGYIKAALRAYMESEK